MKTANLYVRVSTDEQAEKGYSQRGQEEVLRRYCEVNFIAINKVYLEDHSAKTFNRPVWKNLLVNLRKHKGKTNLILFTKWDRFSRNAGDAYQMINTLRRWGVEPQAIEQPLDLSVPENKLMLAIYLATPEVENDRRSLNVFFGIRRAKKEGRWTTLAPTGYVNRSREDGTKYITPAEPQASVIKWAFNEVAKGKYTVEQIFGEAKRKGLRCGKSNFWRQLRNPVYYGKIVVPEYGDEVEFLVNGQHKPIISESLFYQVQEVLAGRKRNKAGTATKMVAPDLLPLRGFLKCPKCHRMLSGSASKGRGGYYHYYHCHSSCGKRFRAEKVNETFEEDLSQFMVIDGMQPLYEAIVLEKFREGYNGGMESQRSITNKIHELNARISQARNLLLEESFDASDYKIVKQDCENQIATLEAQLSEIKLATRNVQNNIGRAFNNLSKLFKVYTTGDVLTRRSIISSLYPENLWFDGFKVRTHRLNTIAFNGAVITKELQTKKDGTKSDFSDLSRQVGVAGFEPTASSSRTKRATGLRYTPKSAFCS